MAQHHARERSEDRQRGSYRGRRGPQQQWDEERGQRYSSRYESGRGQQEFGMDEDWDDKGQQEFEEAYGREARELYDEDYERPGQGRSVGGYSDETQWSREPRAGRAGQQQGDYSRQYGRIRQYGAGQQQPYGQGQRQYGQQQYGQRERQYGQRRSQYDQGQGQYGQGQYVQGQYWQGGRASPAATNWSGSEWQPGPMTQSFRGRGPKGYERSDDRLRELICEALTDDDQIDASDISVEVKSSQVKLTGTVSDRQKKYMVEEMIEDMSGVKEVDNQLRVRREQGDGDTYRQSAGSAGQTDKSSKQKSGSNLGQQN
jgi:osmotically-inducible protein OsmY